MNLQELSSALPKDWLSINAHEIRADQVTTTSFDSSDLIVLKQAGVANPAVNKVAIYADLNGELKTNDSTGNVNIILSQDVAGSASNIPVYAPGGSMLVDSTHSLSEYAPLAGASFTGDISAPHVVSSSVPVQSWRAAKNSTWASLNASTAETSLIGAERTGSLTITEPVVSGFTLDMSFITLYSSGAATTMTLRFKVNGTTVLTSTIPVAVTVNEYLKLEYKLQVSEFTNNRIYVSSTIHRSGNTPLLFADLNDVVWNTAGNNVLSVTGQFNDTDGTWVGTQWDMRSSCPQAF